MVCLKECDQKGADMMKGGGAGSVLYTVNINLLLVCIVTTSVATYQHLAYK